jgi:hypothetical protein
MIDGMPQPTLLYIHGTGVRIASHKATVRLIHSKVEERKLPCRFEDFFWGDLGVVFEGLSLPDPPERTEEARAQAERWDYLRIDPLFDLKLWCTPVNGQRMMVGMPPAWKSIGGYQPGEVLDSLLAREGLREIFRNAWDTLTTPSAGETESIPEWAFREAGGEQPLVARAFAEALAAEMMREGAERNPLVLVLPSVAETIIERLLYDWNQVSKGILKDVFHRVTGWVTKEGIRPLRARASRAIAPAIGDVLAYQAKGEEVREAIHKKLAHLSDDVFLLAHSLGGIASFELLAQHELPKVKGLITAGSQAPLLYELGALESLKPPNRLPSSFPPWLNLCDRNDLLSYCANRLFGRNADQFVDSMLPPLEAHSAYWSLDCTWELIRKFMADPGQTNMPS